MRLDQVWGGFGSGVWRYVHHRQGAAALVGGILSSPPAPPKTQSLLHALVHVYDFREGGGWGGGWGRGGRRGGGGRNEVVSMSRSPVY